MRGQHVCISDLESVVTKTPGAGQESAQAQSLPGHWREIKGRLCSLLEAASATVANTVQQTLDKDGVKDRMDEKA